MQDSHGSTVPLEISQSKSGARFKLGILAYGSLIDDPGKELDPLIIGRIPCETPFKVEFARRSKSRDYAPTLIPVSEGGRNIKAQILILNETVAIDQAMSMLWRREVHIIGSPENYVRPQNPSINSVLVEELYGFEGVDRVLYISIGSNIGRNAPQELADYSIGSIMANAGAKEMDGVRYLLAAKKNGIITVLSEEYENEILRRTNTKSLHEAIQILDRKREHPGSK